MVLLGAVKAIVLTKLHFDFSIKSNHLKYKKQPCAYSTLNYGAGIPKSGDKQFLCRFLQRESHMFICCTWKNLEKLCFPPLFKSLN